MLRQKQLHRRVAALTGDDLSTITRLGFSIVCDTQDPDASDTASHDFDPFTDPAVAELAAWALEDRSPVARHESWIGTRWSAPGELRCLLKRPIGRVCACQFPQPIEQ